MPNTGKRCDIACSRGFGRREMNDKGRLQSFQKIAGWGFENLSFALPVKRLKETETLLAFNHPKPCYPIHILIVPKKALPSFMELTESDSLFLKDLISTVQTLVEDLNLEKEGYRLIVNGGNYQEFPQLHFHLISGNKSTHSSSQTEENKRQSRSKQ